MNSEKLKTPFVASSHNAMSTDTIIMATIATIKTGFFETKTIPSITPHKSKLKSF